MFGNITYNGSLTEQYEQLSKQLDALLEEAEKYGVTTAIGLWQELGAYSHTV